MAALVLTSACGSVSSKSADPAPSDAAAGADGLSVPTSPPAAAGGGVVDPALATPSAGSSTAASPAGGTGQGIVPGAPGAGAAPAAATPTRPLPKPPVSVANIGPKVAPAAPIRLGIIGVDTSAIAAKFGKESTDPFVGIKKMVSYLNANGGIAGHQIKPVFTKVDSGADMEQSGQRACTVLTQDNTVDMVLSPGFASQTLNSCLLKKGISLFSNGNWAPDAQWMAQYPNLFMPTAVRADRYSAAVIATAVKQGTLKSGDKLGVLVEDCDWGNRIYNNVIVPTAAKYGVATEKATVKCITNITDDLGPVTQDIMRDTLLFAAKGATHVFALSAAEGFFDTTFSRVASTQKYFPKYLVTTIANPFVAMDPANVVHFSPDALKNIVGLGFRPALDVGPAALPANDQAAQQVACKKMDSTWGGAAGGSGDGVYFALDGFYGICDTLNAIKTVLTSNGNRFGLADIAAGYQTMLANGTSAAAVGGRYGGGSFRRDGLGLAQPMSYSSATGKLTYTGSIVSVG